MYIYRVAIKINMFYRTKHLKDITFMISYVASLMKKTSKTVCPAIKKFTNNIFKQQIFCSLNVLYSYLYKVLLVTHYSYSCITQYIYTQLTYRVHAWVLNVHSYIIILYRAMHALILCYMQIFMLTLHITVGPDDKFQHTK